MLPEIARHSEKFFYFFEVANEGSLQATARRLNTSAPNMSRAIKQLEAVLGTELFVRSKSGVTLTEAGEKLLAFCRKYFREMEEVQRSIEQPKHQAVRRIKVGTFQSLALYFWPLLIEALRRESNLSLSITTNRSRAILESLIRKDVDVALTVESIKHEKLIRHELFKDDYSFYVRRDFRKSELKVADLFEFAVLYIPDATDESGRPMRQYIHAWNLPFREEFELDSLEVIGEFVSKGYGVGILPTKVAKQYDGTLKPIRVEGVPSKFGTHRFFLSYRDDLDIPQSVMRSLLDTAKKATLQLNS